MTVQAHRLRIGLVVTVALLVALAAAIVVAQMAWHPHLLSGILGGGGPVIAGYCPSTTLICP